MVFGCLAYAYLSLPDVRSLATVNPDTTAFMEIRDNEARAKGKEPQRVHEWIAYRQISPSLKRAVLVAEDAAFWSHDGLDYDELRRAIELDWQKGSLVRGASTITQQLAKNLYLSPSKNPLRKLRELIIARRLEVELEKARILEIYLNVIEWGDGVYGVEAAAQTYFGVSASALGPTESALLAGAIINPRLLNPANPTKRLRNRQRLILARMRRVSPPPDAAPPPVDDATTAAASDTEAVPDVPADEAHGPIDEAASSDDTETKPEGTGGEGAGRRSAAAHRKPAAADRDARSPDSRTQTFADFSQDLSRPAFMI